jgi:hypothetical protein
MHKGCRIGSDRAGRGNTYQGCRADGYQGGSNDVRDREGQRHHPSSGRRPTLAKESGQVMKQAVSELPQRPMLEGQTSARSEGG